MRRRLRYIAIGVVILAAVVGAFIGVVGPLFKDSGPPIAEVTGLFDQQLVAGKAGQQISVAVDNTGFSQISPLCVSADFGPTVTVTSAIFANTDTEAMVNGRVCGGGLVGQETINIIFVVTPTTVGDVAAVVTPMQGSTQIGSPLHGTIQVTSGSN